jgi:AraC-like DNA-binding protein
MLGSLDTNRTPDKEPRNCCVFYAFIDIKDRAAQKSDMPAIAKKALTQRLQHSGLLDRLRADARILFRKRLWFISFEENPPANSVSVSMTVGAVQLGRIGFAASAKQERNEAYRRWLLMAVRIFAQELTAPPAHSVGAVPAKINRAAGFLREHHGQSISLADVAAEVGLSRERLSRLFHESLGINFSEYLTQVRLATAQEQLRRTDRSITEIAYDSGFQSLSQFNRSFAKLEGRSPREFRKSVRAPKTQSRVS